VALPYIPVIMERTRKAVSCLAKIIHMIKRLKLTMFGNPRKKAKELFDFFDNYGHNGIKINVDSE
jgi:hypothetical protein